MAEDEDELGLDSLMDTVFNVVAILILIVLVGAISSGSVRDKIRALPKAEQAQAEEPPDADECAEKAKRLQKQIEQLKRDIAKRKQALVKLAKLLKLEGQVKRLQDIIKVLHARLQKLSALTMQVDDATPETVHQGRNEKPLNFRPPFEHAITQDKPIYYWCVRGQLLPFPLEAVNSAMRQIYGSVVAGVKSGKPLKGTHRKSLPKANCNISYHVKRVANGYCFLNTIVPTRSAKGEALSALEANWQATDFGRRVGASSPKSHYFVFFVYPNGFKAFRTAREIVRQAGFETNWIVFADGKGPGWSSGASSSTTGQ